MFSIHKSNRLTPHEIATLSKSLIINKMHRSIRMWYIENVLPISMIKDPDIIPYFTPCNGHSNMETKNDSTSDEIDGVFIMQAYCLGCQKEFS